MKRQLYRVSELAQLTGVSVRTLHYYDEIRLLVPRARTDAGYRLYDGDDLLRLQQIMIGREQGLALEEIRRSLDDPNFDAKRALLAQRQQLQQRAQETSRMIRAIDAALSLLDDERQEPDMTQLFDGFDPTRHEAEARARWGETDAYKESAQRTKRYSTDDWRQIKEEQAAIYGAAFTLLQAGTEPQAPEAMDVAERHRLAIDRWFYPCSVALHAGLADLYDADSRFAENIDRFGAGLTPFLAAAIRANARRRPT